MVNNVLHLIGLEFGYAVAGVPCSVGFAFGIALNVAVPFVDQVAGSNAVTIFTQNTQNGFLQSTRDCDNTSCYWLTEAYWRTYSVGNSADFARQVGAGESWTVVVVSFEQLNCKKSLPVDTYPFVTVYYSFIVDVITKLTLGQYLLSRDPGNSALGRSLHNWCKNERMLVVGMFPGTVQSLKK